MTARLDHTIVPSTNKRTSADFLASILGTAADPEWGPFVPVSIDNDITLDFVDATDFQQHHYAFLVSEHDFDAMLARVKEHGAGFYADPGRRRPGEINHNDGGRGVYFDDPDHHLMELITRPYETTPR